MSLAIFTETVLRRDRTVVLVGLGTIIVLSWAYLGYLAWDMAGIMAMEMGDTGMAMDMAADVATNLGMEMAMPAIQPWGAVDNWLMFVMWAVMMFAMMTPSAAPMVLTYTKISRRQEGTLQPVWGTAVTESVTSSGTS